MGMLSWRIIYNVGPWAKISPISMMEGRGSLEEEIGVISVIVYRKYTVVSGVPDKPPSHVKFCYCFVLFKWPWQKSMKWITGGTLNIFAQPWRFPLIKLSSVIWLGSCLDRENIQGSCQCSSWNCTKSGNIIWLHDTLHNGGPAKTFS